VIVQTAIPEKPGVADSPIKLMTEGTANESANGPTNDESEDAAANFANPCHQ
jgi:hypothetical protein